MQQVMEVTNERFPHWCRIVRKTSENPMEDESDFSSFDFSAPLDDGGVIVYEGKCRSYKINTTSDRGDVITSQRGLSLPLNQEGWDELGVVPSEGDELVVIHGKSFREYGRVIDKNVATASFAGTHLVWRYVRN